MNTLYRASFNYFDPAYGESRPVEQGVANGRCFDNPGWQVSGFELMQHESKVTDWNDNEQIRTIHYGEVSALAKQLTGATHALVSSHILRNPEQEKAHADLGPIQFVHSDFAASYGDRMRQFYDSGTDEAKAALQAAGISAEQVASASRLAIVQFWRNVGPAVMDLPIAFCDARTVPDKETHTMLVQDYAGGGFDFETLAILAPRDGHHAWYTFPEMQPNEVVVLRTYDSDMLDSGKPFWTPHSAFRDPDVEPGAPARYSIEVRATCLWN